MYFLRSWLQEYIDISTYNDEDLAELITRKSSEVDDIFKKDDYFEGKVLVGKIINLRKHEDAEKLFVFDVEINDQKTVQIVSGAPNITEGMFIPVALNGAKLPFLTIQSRKLRGFESQGMCCGKSELALETEFSSGLWDLKEENNDIEKFLGKSICEAFKEQFPTDTVFDIKVLPDKLSAIGSHLGMARELSFFIEDGQEKLKTPELFDAEYIDAEFSKLDSEIEKSQMNIDFKDNIEYSNSFSMYEVNLDKEYTLPHKYQTRMFLLENNLVGGFADLTNYMLFDIGQPSHIFNQESL